MNSHIQKYYMKVKFLDIERTSNMKTITNSYWCQKLYRSIGIGECVFTIIILCIENSFMVLIKYTKKDKVTTD